MDRITDKLDKNEYIDIKYDEGVSTFRHVNNNDEIKKIKFYGKNYLKLKDNIYYFHNIIGSSFKDEIYNSCLRKSINADDIEIYDYQFTNKVCLKRYMYDIDTDTKEEISYYVDLDRMETDTLYSSLLDSYIELYYDDGMWDEDDYYDDIDDFYDDDNDYYDDYDDYDYENIIKMNDIISFEEYDSLREEDKYDFLFNSAIKYLEKNFLKMSDDKKKTMYNDKGKKYIKKR